MPYSQWKFSSVGRATALQAVGHRFEPYNFHQFILSQRLLAFILLWTLARQCVKIISRGYSSVGRAIRSQRIGRGFESRYLHQY